MMKGTATTTTIIASSIGAHNGETDIEQQGRDKCSYFARNVRKRIYQITFLIIFLSAAMRSIAINQRIISTTTTTTTTISTSAVVIQKQSSQPPTTMPSTQPSQATTTMPSSQPTTKPTPTKFKNRTITKPTPTKFKNRTITILIRYSGEMGNHLSKLAAAYMTQYITKKKYPYISYQFIGEHQNHETKWKKAARELSLCFPNLKLNNMLVFDGGIHDPNFLVTQQKQEKWLKKFQRAALYNVGNEASLDVLHNILQSQEKGLANDFPPTDSIVVNGTYQYSLPYLTSDKMILNDILYDKELYDEIRALLTYNETACCNSTSIQELLQLNSQERQQQDEPTTTNNTSTTIVYHHRNFKSELSVQGYNRHEKSFVEATPYTASRYMFAEYGTNRNDTAIQSQSDNDINTTNADSDITFRHRIIILSRLRNGLEAYQNEFTEYNHIPSYIVENSGGIDSGVQDFCFIMKSPSITIGKLHSTFIGWATLLGNTPIVRLYTIDLVNDDHTNIYNDTTTSKFQILNEINIDGRRFILESYRQPKMGR